MSSHKFGQKWLAFGTSIFTTMSQAAARAGAVNLAQGFPDFDGPDEVKEAAIAAIKSRKNQYAPANGLLELRELLAERQERLSGIRYHPDSEITVVSGATEGLFSTISGLLDHGDEIIGFAPFYDSYPAGVVAAGATFKTIDLTPPHWTFTKEAIEAQISPKTKIILLNTPHNPTGKVFSKEELKVIADIAIKHDLLVVTDEVYEEIVFDDSRHLYLASLPQMRERTITISSTSKTFSMTGWKVGYVFAPERFTQAIRGVHQFTVFCSATPMQWGMVAGLKLGSDYYEELRRDYLKKRNFLVSALNAAGIEAKTPQGTYFAVGSYASLSDKADIDFAMWMTEQIKVAAIPLSPFFQEKSPSKKSLRFLRFAFCKNQETLEKAAQNLGALRG